ncbi:hypothetical protein V1478_004158, partial [Vespula squamosa]
MKVGYREINGKVEIAKEEVEDLLNDVRLKWRRRGTEKEIMDEERKSRNMGKWEPRVGGELGRVVVGVGNKGGFGSEWQTGPMCVCTPAENNVHTEALMRFKNNGDYLHYSLGISAVVALIPTAHGCVPGLLCVVEALCRRSRFAIFAWKQQQAYSNKIPEYWNTMRRSTLTENLVRGSEVAGVGGRDGRRASHIHDKCYTNKIQP